MSQQQINPSLSYQDAYLEGQLGGYFEDLELGNVYTHQVGRKVTALDNAWQSFTNLHHHPAHEKNKLGSVPQSNTLSSLVTLSIVEGLSLASTCARSMTNLGCKKVQLPHPVYVGDTLYAESKVVTKERIKAKPHQGIVTVETRGLNQAGVVCLVWERRFLVPCREPFHRSV